MVKFVLFSVKLLKVPFLSASSNTSLMVLSVGFPLLNERVAIASKSTERSQLPISVTLTIRKFALLNT